MEWVDNWDALTLLLYPFYSWCSWLLSTAWADYGECIESSQVKSSRPCWTFTYRGLWKRLFFVRSLDNHVVVLDPLTMARSSPLITKSPWQRFVHPLSVIFLLILLASCSYPPSAKIVKAHRLLLCKDIRFVLYSNLIHNWYPVCKTRSAPNPLIIKTRRSPLPSCLCPAKSRSSLKLTGDHDIDTLFTSSMPSHNHSLAQNIRRR
jgi:hypothetical protein